jgi:hypothetical protein
MNTEQCHSLIMERLNTIRGTTVRNPRTGLTISVNARAFQNLLRECSNLGNEEINQLIEQYITAYRNENQRNPPGSTVWRTQIQSSRVRTQRQQQTQQHPEFAEFVNRIERGEVSEFQYATFMRNHRFRNGEMRALINAWNSHVQREQRPQVSVPAAQAAAPQQERPSLLTEFIHRIERGEIGAAQYNRFVRTNNFTGDELHSLSTAWTAHRQPTQQAQPQVPRQQPQQVQPQVPRRQPQQVPQAPRRQPQQAPQAPRHPARQSLSVNGLPLQVNALISNINQGHISREQFVAFLTSIPRGTPEYEALTTAWEQFHLRELQHPNRHQARPRRPANFDQVLNNFVQRMGQGAVSDYGYGMFLSEHVPYLTPEEIVWIADSWARYEIELRRQAELDNIVQRIQRGEVSRDEYDTFVIRNYDELRGERMIILVNAWSAHERALRAPSVSPSAKSLISSASPTSDEEILHTCSAAFAEINQPPFKGLGNKLLKGCSKLDASKHCTDNAVKELYEKLKSRYLTNDNGISMNDLRHDAEMSLLFRRYHRHNESYDRGLRCHLTKQWIKYEGEDGIGPGIAQNCFQKALNQVFTKHFFVPTEEGSERCLINSKVDVSEFFPGKGNANSIERRKRLFEFIGSLMAFCMITGRIKSDLHLSRSIQARFLYKKEEMTREDYILYYLLEFTSERPAHVNLLKNPEHIEMAYLEFNDPVVLDPARGEETLKASNYRSYLELLSQHKLKLKESEPYLEALLKGFFVTRRFLRNKNVHMTQLDAMMTGSELTGENVEEIIQKVLSYGVPQSREVTWFFNILRDNGSKFPTAVAQEEPSTRPQTVSEFKKQLLFFWTGSRSYNSEFRYKIVRIDNDVFKAHTCFQQIDIPTRVESQKAMYEMLVRTVGLDGFGFA